MKLSRKSFLKILRSKFCFFCLSHALILTIIFLGVSTFYAERLPIKTYTVADGLLRDFVYRIKQDSRGFLWFCTAEGISRFDGAGMTSFTAADGLPDSAVADFLETKNGVIYFATNKGLVRLNPDGMRGAAENPLFTVFLPNNKRAEKIQILYEDRNNQVWVGTSDGLYKLIEADGRVAFESVLLGAPLPGVGGAIQEPDPNSVSVSTILETKNGVLWIGTTGSGLFRLSPSGGVRRFTAPDGLGDNKITDLLEDRNGHLWVSKRSDVSGGVCRLDAAEESSEQPVRKCYSVKDGLGSNWIRDMFETSDGGLWLATIPGLCRFQPEGDMPVCKIYSAKNDLCNDAFALAEDKDGNLWTGSSCGAKKIARYGFTTYNAADGLDSNHITSIFENSTGELFAATYPASERVISRFDGEKFSAVKPRLPASVDYHGWGWQQTVWQDTRGAWWIPTGYGVFRSPDRTSFEKLANTTLKKQDLGMEDPEIFRLFEDSRGDIWIITTSRANKLLRWERAKNVWHDYTRQAGFSEYRVGSALVEDNHGNVWIGATSDHGDSALIRYRPDGEFRVLTEAEGAPSGWIRDLFLDSRGRLWIASTGDGAWRLDETNSDSFKFIKYTPENGLTSMATACVTEDEFGRIYIGTWRGIDRLNPDTGQIENYTTADGLPASFVETAYRDRKNNLWFAGENGLARFIPEPPRTRTPPNIFITGLRVEGLPQRVSILGETSIPELDLKSDQRQITVDFIGLGASLGEKLRYEYRLNDGNWTPTTGRTVNFANLASGSYRFEVRAQTDDQFFSQPAVFSFKIAVPIWRQWWFIALMIAFTALSVYLIYRYRLTQLLEMERTRTRIATDLHDDIGTNLSKISLLSEVVNLQLADQNAESSRWLNSIAEISRESVSSMSDIVWAINPKRDSVLELVRRMRLHAEESFLEKGVRVKFNAPEDGAAIKLSMDVRRELYLIFKEAVSNAARHSDCKNIEINFQLERGAIFLNITDNGKGFDASARADGNGLENMRSRAAKNGGNCSIESEAGRGTIVKIRFPQN